VFIPEKTHKQNLPSYLHTVCVPIWNISHIVSTLLHCGIQTNDQNSTHSQRLVPLLPSNLRRKEQLGQCSNLIKCQTELDPGKPSLPSFWRTKKIIRRKPMGFGFSGFFDFLFLSCSNKFSVRWTRYFLVHHEYLTVGSDLAHSWYLMLGEPQQKWTAKK
jgi:hypothetical protein